MGIYVNPGSDKFEEAIRSEIYVDKSGMISYLNTLIDTRQKYVSVSRPRRFGKTMATDMISAFYDCSIDTRQYFELLAVGKTPSRTVPVNPLLPQGDQVEIRWDAYLNKFNVIQLNMIDFASETGSVTEMILYLESQLTDDLLSMWPDIQSGSTDTLRIIMEKVYKATGIKFVVIIDEWDCIFRKHKEDTDGQSIYLDFLRNWLKDKPYIALAYLTGILPIKKYGEHSALNMFTEYSMTEPAELAEYVGFTDVEVEDLCNKYGRSYEALKTWYDGYKLYGPVAPHGAEPPEYHVYSPLSVVRAVSTGNLNNYWNETETSEALKEYIKRNYDGLKEDVAVLMQGDSLPVDITTYQNDMTTFHSKDDIFTLLIHLGYLGYDKHARTMFIPNREVDMRSDEVAEMIEDAHMRAGNQTYNSEAALSYAIRLAYYSAEEYYTIIPEMQAGKGYADLVYIPAPAHADRPAMLIELKWNQDADTAIEQIHRQRYPEALKKYAGNIILVGINYDKEIRSGSMNYKHHSCIIEKA